MTFKTPYRIEKENKEMTIYREYKKLTANPNNAIGAVKAYLMDKYDIHAQSTIWNICKRVEARLAQGKAN